MSTQIKDTKKSIVLENSYVAFEMSKKDSKILSVTDKATGNSIISAEEAFFFEAKDFDGNIIRPTEVKFNGDVA
ncbi:MAG: hypothetical protein IKU19_06030, partial [Clostridia bacterium]|nr:hypothetical protein [Clostridia bacterium]